jgi:hypothetical protein
MNIQSIINQANLIVANHHDSVDGCGGSEFAHIKLEVLREAGFSRGEVLSQDTWDDYLESDDVPEELRGPLIALDDAMTIHKNTQCAL